MAKRNSTLIPAAGYARRSTDLQERSIPDQKAYIEKWAAEHGYRIVRWYIDDAISGTSSRGRDDFARMIDTAENGRDFDTVLCYDISRFSRGGTNETGYYLHRLKMAGVEVLFPADAIPEGDEGELIQGVKSWQARQYSVKLARDTIRGQISNIRQRRSAPGGMAPYGYDKQHLSADGTVLRTLRWMADGSKQEFGPDGKLLRVIEPGVNIKKAKSDVIRYVPSAPDRVAVLKRMFDLCCQGYGFHYIAQTFNEEGIPSPGGQKWNTARIGKLLRNPVYRGAIAWNRHTMGSLFGLDGQGVLRPKRSKGWRKNDESDWIISEDVHEPLVSRETWDAAQRCIAKRRADAGKARPTNRSLLSGLMVCKRCGHGFTTVRDRRWPGPTGEGYRSYRCCGYHRYGKGMCKAYGVPGPALDAFVLDTIKRLLLGDHKTTKKAIDAFVATVLAPKPVTKRKKTDGRELELLNRKIKATVAMLADPTFDGLDELRITLTDLKNKRDALAARLKPVEQPATPAFTEKELQTWALAQFAHLDDLATRTTIDLKDRQMIEAFVQRIEVNPESKTGIVYVTPDLEDALKRGFTRGPIGDFMGAHEWCQPPDTMVMTPSGGTRIASLRDGDEVMAFAPRSWAIIGYRNGPPVKVGTRHYGGPLYGVSVGDNTTWCTDGHLFSARLTSDAPSTWCVYLMRRGRWWRVGKTKLLTTWGLGIKQRLETEDGEEAWILSTHSSNSEATCTEQVVSARYGIPTTFWRESRASVRTESQIARIYDRIDPIALHRGALWALSDHHRRLEHPFIRRGRTRAKYGRRVSFLVRACNLLPGAMEVPLPTRGPNFCWTPIRHVDVQPYSGPVYSLDVAKYHHYIADGIVTHNCFYGWRLGAGHQFFGPNNATDLWAVKKVNPNKMIHLTEKPVELAVRAMQYSSKPGENVLELFGGSGSTLIACEQTGRRCYAMELDTLYCDVIVKRWEEFTGRKASLA